MTEKKKNRKTAHSNAKDGGEENAVDKNSQIPTATADAAEAQEATTQATAPTDAPGELWELHNRFLRLKADFDNYKKRTARERTDLYRMANEDLIVALLPVLDHMELAIQAGAKHGVSEAFIDGFRLVGEQLAGALIKFGLQAVEAEGARFDPNSHEAVAHIPSAEVEDGRVSTQVRRGYRLGEKLLRAAQVVVSSGTPEDAVAAETDANTGVLTDGEE